MKLFDLIRLSKPVLSEGGNLQLPNPNDPNAPHAADKIDLKVHNRSFMVGLLDKALHDIDRAFQTQFKQPLWSPELLQSKQFLGGSSLHFFDLERDNPDYDPNFKPGHPEYNPNDVRAKQKIGISDEEFAKYKPKVGDIDTQINKELEPQVEQFLNAYVNKKIGDVTFLGFDRGNEQFNGLFQFDEPPIKIQIDLEFGKYNPETNTPDDWYRFSHSSAWNDVTAGVKGVMHKYIYRALAKASPTEKYIAKLVGAGKNRKMTITGPITDSNFSFAVASAAGGGARAKYKPYIDPATGEEKVIDGVPVMEPVKPEDSDYIQDLHQQFELFFGQPPSEVDRKLQDSFLGTLDLMNKYLDDQAKQVAYDEFLKIVFEVGAQMIDRDDPASDKEVKFAAIDNMVEKLGLGKQARQVAIKMQQTYEADYHDLEAFKKAFPNIPQPRVARRKAVAAGEWKPLPGSSLNEAEEQPAVVASTRKGVPHLEKMKDKDFLDFISELKDTAGNFKLDNISMNVKVDGFGGRFGKDANGRPYFESSHSGPIFSPTGFSEYNNERWKDSAPDVQQSAQKRGAEYDKMWAEVIEVIDAIDAQYGEDFLLNAKVWVECLYMPFAKPQEDGRLVFVGIAYDFPKGANLVLVPYQVTLSNSGKTHPKEAEILADVKKLGTIGTTKIISNALEVKGGLDVTAHVPPVENVEHLKELLASNKLAARQQVKSALNDPNPETGMNIKQSLADFIINHPNIVGKNILGKDYEGIVINAPGGPVKITSPEQRQVIANKQDARNKPAAPAVDVAEKTAVVTIGSFAGHRGHEQLINHTIAKAQELNGTPFVFISNAVNKNDDPLSAETKEATVRKLFPNIPPQNISLVKNQMMGGKEVAGNLFKKIEHELVKPTKGGMPDYTNIVIVVGMDRYEGKESIVPRTKMMQDRINSFGGPYANVKLSVVGTERDPDKGGTGVSFTQARNVLKDPNQTYNQKLDIWCKLFNEKVLGRNYISKLMAEAAATMGVALPQMKTKPTAPVAQPVPQPQIAQQPVPQEPTAPVAEQRVLNAILRPRKVNETARMSAAVKLQRAWELQQQKSAASRKRGQELLNPPKKDEPKKDEKAAEGAFGIGWSHKPEDIQKIHNWQNSNTGTDSRMFQGYKMKFTANGTLIYKGGDLVYTRPGDFSNPTNKDIMSAKNIITRLISKEKSVSEKMMPTSNFAGSKKNKLGPAGQLKATDSHAKSGDLVGGTAQEHIVKVKGGYELKSKHGNKNLGKYPTKSGAEKREREVQYFKHAGEEVETEGKIKGADGKACWKGKRYAGTENGKDKCIPVSEDVQNIMDVLINKIIVNEAIQNNKRRS